MKTYQNTIITVTNIAHFRHLSFIIAIAIKNGGMHDQPVNGNIPLVNLFVNTNAPKDGIVGNIKKLFQLLL